MSSGSGPPGPSGSQPATPSSGSGLRFSLAGFPVAVPLNTIFGVALIAWLWLPSFASSSTTRQWASAIIFAVALLASVLAHELAHAWAARRFGFPVLGITLWAFGGFTSYRPIRNTPGREAAIAISGPAATFAVAASAWAAGRLWDAPPMAADILAAIALANAFVGVFNVLPGLPLDGGSVLSAGIWAVTGSRSAGQRFAAYTGMVLAALIVAVPLWQSWRDGGSASIGFVFVSVLLAGFLFVGARGALQSADADAELDDRTALDLAVPAIVIPETASIAALDEYLARLGQPQQAMIALVGEPATGIRGYVLPPAMAAVPVPARASTPVTAVARSVPDWTWLPAATPAAEAMGILQRSAAPIVLVDQANRPVAVIIARSR